MAGADFTAFVLTLKLAFLFAGVEEFADLADERIVCTGDHFDTDRFAQIDRACVDSAICLLELRQAFACDEAGVQRRLF